jgi:uncharacterized RDD family membrane protein YckC
MGHAFRLNPLHLFRGKPVLDHYSRVLAKPSEIMLIRRIAGVFVLLLATVLVGWIGYNLFIGTPEASGKSLLPALGFVIALIYVGIYWIRGKTAG